jgi:alkylation response protein AidB-like acyl-CoA dehydrogenase
LTDQTTIEAVRTLAQDIATRASDADKAGKLPDEDIQALRESGYLTMSVPAEYGGQGLSLRECVTAQ